jgi:hypothetical protein
LPAYLGAIIRLHAGRLDRCHPRPQLVHFVTRVPHLQHAPAAERELQHDAADEQVPHVARVHYPSTASIAAAACCCMFGVTCEYRSNVIDT